MTRALRALAASRGRNLILVPFVGIWMAAVAPAAVAREAFVGDATTDVTVLDLASNQVSGGPISLGFEPFGLAITPDGRTAYGTNIDFGTVRKFDTATRQVASGVITVGGGPFRTAITPDGKRVYIADGGTGSVVAFDTDTNLASPPIPVGNGPDGIAITPDGRTAYVADSSSSNVFVVEIPGDRVLGSPIPVGIHPQGIAITPDGTRAYVANSGSASVSVINTATNQVIGEPITVGGEPQGIAITPDGARAYVANAMSDDVSVIDTATNRVIGEPIMVGNEPKAVAITPDGSKAYVANRESGDVSVIDTGTMQVVGAPIKVGAAPESIAIPPDQPPVAAFTSSVARPGVPVAFDASGSSDPDGSIARFDWGFGDGHLAAGAGASPEHTYANPGNYRVSLTLTDNEGCSTRFIYTGQVAYCNGGPAASLTQALSVAYPAVRVRCPKRAGTGGCRFRLTAVTKRRRGRAMAPVAKGKAKAGRSTLISVRPKKKFAARLASARTILVREAVTIGGSNKTRYLKAKVAN